MLAASRVIGRKGYKAASIARIAEEAGISIGHCYKFFDSRDAILENVILWILDKFEEFSEKKLSKSKNYLEFERDAINRYFDFQRKHPFFIKILRDSEVETPETWKKFSDRRFERYIVALTAAFDKGEITGFRQDELKYVSRMLSSMRRTIVFNYPDKSPAREEAVAAYEIFVRQALGMSAVSASSGNPGLPAPF
jgi:AcrR family transcriptional regulator